MARPALGSSSTERLHMKITADEIADIENWRYAKRVPSRSEAVRQLVRFGLAHHAHVRSVFDASEMLVALHECEEYLDNRADADCDQDGYIPNKEMQLLATVRAAIAKAEDPT